MIVYYVVFVVLLKPGVQPGCSDFAAPNASAAEVKQALQCKIYSHYAPFILIGILGWNFTAGSVMSGMYALLGNSSVAKKVYFPREVLPISTVLAQLVNYLLALIPLAAIILISGLTLSSYVLLLPVIFFFHCLFMIGLAMILCIVVLHFRDLLVIMEVLLQAWFFLTPIIYTMDQVFSEGSRQAVYWINPIASFIETYRTLLFFGYAPEPLFTLRTCLSGLLMFVVGYAFFMWKRKQIGELL